MPHIPPARTLMLNCCLKLEVIGLIDRSARGDQTAQAEPFLSVIFCLQMYVGLRSFSAIFHDISERGIECRSHLCTGSGRSITCLLGRLYLIACPVMCPDSACRLSACSVEKCCRQMIVTCEAVCAHVLYIGLLVVTDLASPYASSPTETSAVSLPGFLLT